MFDFPPDATAADRARWLMGSAENLLDDVDVDEGNGWNRLDVAATLATLAQAEATLAVAHALEAEEVNPRPVVDLSHIPGFGQDSVDAVGEALLAAGIKGTVRAGSACFVSLPPRSR